MKFAALAFLSLFTVAACDQRQGDETGRAVDAADTIVTSEENLDTTVITQDTAVDVDTVRHEGDSLSARILCSSRAAWTRRRQTPAQRIPPSSRDRLQTTGAGPAASRRARSPIR